MNPNRFINFQLFTSDNAFRALNISIITNTDNDKVEGFYFPHEKYKQGSLLKSYLSKLFTVKSFQS